MPKNRRKSDVSALRPWSKDAQGSKSSFSRRKTISVAGVDRVKESGSHPKENQENDMTNHSSMSMSSRATPSKPRVNLGSASNYYFKNLPKTPLQKMVASAKKRHHNISSVLSKPTDHSYLSNSSDSSASDADDSLNSSMDQAMADLKQILDTNHVSETTKNTIASNGACSTSDSSSGASSDAINRSVLSDTTELTASNFVFAASSKQGFWENCQQKKREEQDRKQKGTTTTGNISRHLSPRKPLEELISPTCNNTQKVNESAGIAPSNLTSPVLPNQAIDLGQNMINGKDCTRADSNESKDLEGRECTERTKAPSSPSEATQTTTELQPKITTATSSHQAARKSDLSLLRARVHVSPSSLRKFTDSLKKNRLQRKLERDQDIKRRLSMGSAKKHQAMTQLATEDVVPGACSIMARHSMGGAPSSTRESLSSVVQGRRSYLEIEDSAGELELSHWNLSNKTAQTQLESNSPGAQRNEHGMRPRDGTAITNTYDNDDTAEINFDYDKWIREPIHGSSQEDHTSSVQNSHSAVVLRRLSRATENEAEPANNGTGTPQENEKDKWMQGNIAPEAGQTPLPSTHNSPSSNASKDSVERLLDGIELRKSPPASEDEEKKTQVQPENSKHDDISQRLSPSASISSPAEDGHIGSNHRRSSLPGEIIVPSQETTDANHEGPASQAADPSSLLARRLPGSASKLNPTRLSKKPRRVANPDSLLSPAKNTRSSKKRHQSEILCLDKNRESGSDETGNLENIASKPQETNKTRSDDSTVATRNSYGSVTASLGDFGEIFDMANEMGENNIEDNKSRRETASYSDFGEMLGLVDDEQHVPRNSLRRSARRSSMHRASLASLPEQAAHNDVSNSSKLRRSSDVTASMVDLRGIPEDDLLAAQDQEAKSKSNVHGISTLSLATVNSEEAASDKEAQDRVVKSKKDVERESQTETTAVAQDDKSHSSDNSTRTNASGQSEEDVTMCSKATNAGSSSASTRDLEELLSGYMSPNTTASERQSIEGMVSSNSETKIARCRRQSSTTSRSGMSETAIDAYPKDSPACNTRSATNEKQKTDCSSFPLTRSMTDSIDHSSTADLRDLPESLPLGSESTSPERSTFKEAEQRHGVDDNPTGLIPRYIEQERLTMKNEITTSATADPASSLGGSDLLVKSPPQTMEMSSPNNVLKKRQRGPPDQNPSSEEKTDETELDSVNSKSKRIKCNFGPGLPKDDHESSTSCDLIGATPDEESTTTEDELTETNISAPTRLSSFLSTQPHAVLNSALKKPRLPSENRNPVGSSTKKRVGFRSPQAAEYDKGSASVSYTPMPKKQAKELYSIPSSPSESMSVASSTTSESSTKGLSEGTLALQDPTMTLEHDMKCLVDKLGEGGDDNCPSKDCSSPDRNEAMDESTNSDGSWATQNQTVELETSFNGLLYKTSSRQDENCLSNTAYEDYTEAQGPTDDSVGWLVNKYTQYNKATEVLHEVGPLSSPQSSSLSIEKTDMGCIACVNNADEGDTQSLDGQQLNFESPSQSQKNSTQEDETVPLETDMDTMIDKIATEQSGPDLKQWNDLDVSAIPLSSPSQHSPPVPYHSQEKSLNSSMKDEFPGGFSVSQGSAFAGPGQDATVPLEKNIHEMFAATAYSDSSSPKQEDPEKQENAGLITSPRIVLVDHRETSEDNIHSRRSSISSYRFSLAPEGRLSISKDGDVSAPPAPQDECRSLKKGDSVQESDVNVVRLTCEELFERANLAFEGMNQARNHGDSIVSIQSHLQGIMNHIVAEKFSIVLDAVCNQLENDTNDIPDPNDEFDGLLENKSEFLSDLMMKLSLPQSCDIVEGSLQSLGRNVLKSLHFQWVEWLSAVMGTLAGMKEDALDNLTEDMAKLDSCCGKVDEGFQLVSKMADASALHARRMSLKRRKVIIYDLNFAACDSFGNSVYCPLLCRHLWQASNMNFQN